MLHDPVFWVGILPVHPFGLCVAIGIVVGYVAALWSVLRAELPARYLPGMLLVVVLGAFIVARLGYIVEHPSAAPDGLPGVLALWRGGLSLAFGILGGALLLAVYTWARREPLWPWADALAPAAALGLAVGMLGTPYGGEGWGEPTLGPIFMRVDPRLLPNGLVNATRFHPIFAYETALFAVIAALLLGLSLWQRRTRRPVAGTGGLAFVLLTMLGYGTIRPLTLDASNPTLVLRTQMLCAVAAAIALGLLAARLRRGDVRWEL